MARHSKEKILALIDLENPPELTFHPRQSVLGVPGIRAAAAWDSGIRAETALGLVLLWHDHWQESHAIAQAHEGVRDFDLLHAIGHRREGDYGNSSYWFKEAGNHPMFGSLSSRIEALFGMETDLLGKILPSGKWNPAAFVKSVKQHPDHPVLRSIQALEFQCFLEFLVPETA